MSQIWLAKGHATIDYLKEFEPDALNTFFIKNIIYELIVLLQTGNFALFESQFLLEFFTQSFPSSWNVCSEFVSSGDSFFTMTSAKILLYQNS